MEKEKTAMQEFIDWMEKCTLYTDMEDIIVKAKEIKDTVEREYLINQRVLTYSWRNDDPEKAIECATAWYNDKYGEA